MNKKRIVFLGVVLVLFTMVVGLSFAQTRDFISFHRVISSDGEVIAFFTNEHPNMSQANRRNPAIIAIVFENHTNHDLRVTYQALTGHRHEMFVLRRGEAQMHQVNRMASEQFRFISVSRL
jgi:hypothetical protein